MKFPYSLIVLMMMSSPLVAQVMNVRVGLGANQPLITTVSEEVPMAVPIPAYLGYVSYYPPTATLRSSFKEKPGFNVTGSFDARVSKRFFISSGLSFSYHRFKKTTVVEYPNNTAFNAIVTDIAIKGVTYGELWKNVRPDVKALISEEDKERIGKTTYMTVQLPVLAGTRVHNDKIGLKAGVVTSFVVSARSHRYDFINVEKYDAKDDFTSVSPGAMFEADYNLTSHLSMALSGQKFFNGLYKKDSRQGGNAKLNLLALNVYYRLKS